MKRILWLVLITAGIGFVIIDISCNSNEAKKETEFYYYPKSNVYYDVSKKTYVYSLNGGKSWESLTDSSSGKPEALGKKIVIHAATDSVWKENEAHRKLYGGVLYNVADEDSAAAVASGTVVSERETAIRKKHKAAMAEANKDPEKRRPIRKFFEKIFGKRKNK